MNPITERVATRFALEASLDVGRSLFTETGLKIHHYRGSVQITDMENAGKRGKKVRQLVVLQGTHNDAEGEPVLRQAIDITLAAKGYDDAKLNLEAFLKHEGNEKLYKLEERTYRGVDVEPMGTTIRLTNKSPAGGQIQIEASPNTFLVKNSTPLHAPNKPAHGFMQDTLYYPLKKQDGALFYTWLKDNIGKAAKMTMDDLRKTWNDLGVRYDSH